MQSTRSIGRAALLLLDFAPDEVCHANIVANTAVGSYPAISPLPCRAVYFLLHFLSLKIQVPGVTRHHALRSPDFPPSPSPVLADDGQGGSLVHRKFYSS